METDGNCFQPPRTRAVLDSIGGIVSLALTVHFAIAGTLWILVIVDFRTFLAAGLVDQALFCFTLLGLSVFSLITFIMRRKIAYWFVAIVVIAASLLFCYDVHFQRWTYESGMIIVGDPEFGKPFKIMCTWWWYK